MGNLCCGDNVPFMAYGTSLDKAIINLQDLLHYEYDIDLYKCKNCRWHYFIYDRKRNQIKVRYDLKFTVANKKLYKVWIAI